MTELEPREQTPTRRDWFERWLDAPFRWPELWERSAEGVELMKVEEFEDDDHLVVKAEMPGLDPENDVEISVSNHTLHIRAERRQETKVEEKGRYHSEFRYGSFARTVPLPIGATEKDVEATYKDGILEIHIPVDERKAEARKVPVQRA